jgi:hypothetical protein
MPVAQEVWPAPIAKALLRATVSEASPLPDQRTSRQPEADARKRAHQRLVEIFHGLDDMRLAEDEVGVV